MDALAESSRNPVSGKRNKIDYVITSIVIVIIAVLISCSFYLKSTSKDNLVSIKYYNKEVYKMSLAKDEVFVMKKEKYDKLLDDLVIEVKDGKVRVKEEESPKHYCSILGFVEAKGTSIICAPNGVVITIEGKSDDIVDWQPGGM